MTQINFTLSEEEILQVLTGNRDEGMVISDAHNSIRQALAKVYPSAAFRLFSFCG